MQVAVDARSWRSVSGRLPKRRYGARRGTSLAPLNSLPSQVNECQRLSEGVSGHLRLHGDTVTFVKSSVSFQMEPNND